MSRRTDGRGPSFADALRAALADLLDADADHIVLRIDAPGVDDLQGRIALDLDIQAPVPEPEDDDAEESSAPRPERAASSDGTNGDGPADDDEPADRVVTIEDLEQEADAAADFLEGLLDALDLPGDIRIRTTADHAEVEVVEIGSGALIGRRGQTLEAIQELVRCALQREFQRRSRVKVDAEGYRARRLEKLIEKAEEAIDEVLDTGEPVRLEPMDVFERKSVHQIVADVDGVLSRSQGREPARRVVIERD
ncbi:protein jag [Nitriliruptor alkaliphilus]|uniref:Jag family protein n=1 Tax=Nitriliruptor alkaliphilus TaxID=427918 RepID=UPI0006988A6A|nr:R3H domain-containing nucleic acid-binding protein [Nitriliruptor alkaliphilus]